MSFTVAPWGPTWKNSWEQVRGVTRTVLGKAEVTAQKDRHNDRLIQLASVPATFSSSIDFDSTATQHFLHGFPAPGKVALSKSEL